MGFFKRLFGGGGASPGGGRSGDPDGLYFYVRPDRCAEVVRVRINKNNDLSELENESGFWAHKLVRGQTCYTNVELDLYFDVGRKYHRHTITGGALVTEADWRAYQAAQAAPKDGQA